MAVPAHCPSLRSAPMGVAPSFKRVVLHGVIRTPLRGLALHRYDYMYEPAQLVRLATLLDEALAADGSIVEIGCAHGRTTVFLNRFLDDVAPERNYVAIDTFSGFTESDVREERRRGRRSPYERWFRANSPQVFERTMALNGVDRPEVVEADVNDFDFASLGTIAFCLVDVDLYRPVLAALEGVWPRLAAGGVIVVDDCDPDDRRWSGAHEAYIEFSDAIGVPPTIELRKLGIIRRDA